MSEATVTVFGGSGFLGRAIVARLLEGGMEVRVAARAPERLRVDAPEGRLSRFKADVRDAATVETAVAGAGAVVNAVGLYVERRGETFEAVHVEGAAEVARRAARAGVDKLVHVSGIGTDPASPSKYVRARGQGEHRVQASFEGATVLRPSVLFGPGDAFLTTLDAITRAAPVFPLFGRGDTRLQPVFVGDVAEAVARILEGETARGRICELGGPQVLSYREVVEKVLSHRGRHRLLLPVPFAVWSLQARLLGLLPNPPLTSDQVSLMRADNVVGEGVLTFGDLGVTARSLDTLLAQCLPG